jgi:uncharacterized protein (TIGR03083 family)
VADVRRGPDPTARLLKQLDAAWSAFRDSYAGLSDEQLQEPGVVGDWSVKDLLAHVTIWEQEALRYLPLIMEGGTPPRYKTYGGIDAFNARMIEERRMLSLSEVRTQLEETHEQLVDFVANVPMEHLSSATRARKRLRLDTYSHYPEHTKAIQEWRQQRLGV